VRAAQQQLLCQALKQLERHIPAFKRLASFSPYVAGDSFTLADCSAWVSLPLVGMATKTVYGEDLLAAQGVDWKAYVKLVERLKKSYA
jgi:glutathione S-transferase